jgi:holo-[acyl-carrier protein] synthase
VTTRGRVSIPAEIRRKFNIESESRVEWIVEGSFINSERFEMRVFTKFERQFCSGRKNRVACLALRFSAKEAFVTALGLGMRKPVLRLDMEIWQDALGKLEIFLTSPALRYCRDNGVRS